MAFKFEIDFKATELLLSNWTLYSFSYRLDMTQTFLQVMMVSVLYTQEM